MADGREFPYFRFSKTAFTVKENVYAQMISAVVALYYLINSCDNFFRSLSEGRQFLEDLLETIMVLYWLSMVVNSRIYRKETTDLVATLKENLHDYEFHEELPEVQDEIREMYKTRMLAEFVIDVSFTKALVTYVLWPSLYSKPFYDILSDENDLSLSKITAIVSLVGNAVVNIATCFLGSYFHIGYQVFLVNAVTCLRREIKIMALSVSQIDVRVKKLMVQMKIEAEMFHWNELPSESRVLGRLQTLKTIEEEVEENPQGDIKEETKQYAKDETDGGFEEMVRDKVDQRPEGEIKDEAKKNAKEENEEEVKEKDKDQILWEICLSKCLAENIPHHQKIIRCVNKMNQVIQVCLFTYGNTIALALGISTFMIAQEEDTFSFNSFLVLLICLPSLLSMRLLCFFGQSLENESEDLRTALYGCPWIGKSQSFLRSLRIMMLLAAKPLQLRAVMFSYNNKKLLEFLNGAYNLLNFLTNMKNKSK